MPAMSVADGFLSESVLRLEGIFRDRPADLGVGSCRTVQAQPDPVLSQLIWETTGSGQPMCLTLLTCSSARWVAPAGYAFSASPWGGYLLALDGSIDTASYWIPLLPRRVTRDEQGRLLSIQPAALTGFQVDDKSVSVSLAGRSEETETVVWRIPAGQRLDACSALERSSWYMLGSHSVLRGRADVYRHLVVGTVFESRTAWPNTWRVFSENDAHAMHLVLGGLALSTGDALLRAQRVQVLLAVLARQGNDGGFHHGEWTQKMESHYRLHCSAMHLMMDVLSEQNDAAVRSALTSAAAFLAQQSVDLKVGKWLLHDELEHSVAQMKLGPFR